MRFFSIGNIEELDFNKLVKQLPGSGGWNASSTRGRYVRAILESHPLLEQYEINTPMRLAHFIGQGLVETGYLTLRVENLNYSAARLREIFPNYFHTEELAREYERQPERIANRVYADRLGNGPPESGEGWRYRGRGFFQLTGKDNYRRYGEVAGVDLVNDPELIERDLKKSIQVAAAYFQHVGLGPYADRDDSAAVSRGVNRGDPRAARPAHGEALRIQWTNKAMDLVRDPQALLARAANDEALRSGATGERVRTLQAALSQLGYAVGPVDGVFGPATRRAVLAFQDEHELPVTGAVDPATQAALDAALAPVPEPSPAEQPPAEQPSVEQPVEAQPSETQAPESVETAPPPVEAHEIERTPDGDALPPASDTAGAPEPTEAAAEPDPPAEAAPEVASSSEAEGAPVGDANQGAAPAPDDAEKLAMPAEEGQR